MSLTRLFPVLRWGASSIRLRLLLAMAMLLLLLVGVAAIAFQNFRTLTAEARMLVDQQARYAFLASRANQHTQRTAHHLLRLLLEPSREARVALYVAKDEAQRIADQALTQLEMAAGSNRLAENVNNVRKARERYVELFQETVEKIELLGLVDARRHFEEMTEPALKEVLSATERLATAKQDAMEETVQRLTDEAATAQRRVVLIAVGALLIGVLLAGLVARSIVGPVNDAVELADRIAEGDYAGTVPAGGPDEVGSMLRALSSMRASIAQREAHISRLAYRDPLTDLPNRTCFFEHCSGLDSSRSGALLLLNLDRFRPINKVLGHQVGDALLREVAARLTQAVPQEVRLARLAGDEFALYWPDISRESVLDRVRALLLILREPITISGQRLDVDATCGIALFPGDGADISRLMHAADAALRAAKRSHAGFAMAADHVETQSFEQLSLIGEMREALAQDQFVPHYQAKLDLRSRQIVAAEALIRWNHPSRGLVPPGQFIPFAEQTGFIREITPWLVRRVIADMAQWRQLGIEIEVSVNLSTFDLLNASLVDIVVKALEVAALPSHSLCLEITESALMVEPERALRHLQQLAAHGLRLSIDDYGSGQASLAYVKNLPVHELKIDRLFVTDVDTVSKNAAIVRSTALLCRELGLKVVAEGAERAGEIDWLADNGCDLVQGFGVARPLAAEAFMGLFNERKLRAA